MIVDLQRRPQGADATLGRRDSAVPDRRAFSLAELMIALAILAMGLLVIGAALPVGARYTQQSVNLATGDAAAEYALDLIEQSVCLPRRIFDDSLPPVQSRAPGLFQPRRPYAPADPDSGLFDPVYEPLIKVRPLWTQNICSTPGGFYGVESDPASVLVERMIFVWLKMGIGVDPNNSLEFDPQPAWIRPALPSVAAVYPPVTPDVPFTQAGFFNSVADMYAPRPVLDVSAGGAETRKVLDQRMSWTAFYRRTSYDPNEGGDPAAYEFVVVVSRLPSPKHRYPIQDENWVGKSTSATARAAADASAVAHSSLYGALQNQDTAAPVPWLISFTGLAVPANGFDTVSGFALPPAPATLNFQCDPKRSGLLPVGAVFIPARNDLAPSHPWFQTNPAARVGFSPPSPTALPIYEVVERPDETTVIVKYNGFYPVGGSPGNYFTPAPGDWPVWVVPPAYEEVDGSRRPIMPDQSPIVAVARRVIRLREIP